MNCVHASSSCSSSTATASSMPSGCRGPSAALKTRDDVAIVCGALLEREPERSIYNRICAIEWNGPVGEVATCGGNFLIRAESFRKVGGFNPTIIAAEDDDLCLRVRATGGKILRLDAADGLARRGHDAPGPVVEAGRPLGLRVRAGLVDSRPRAVPPFRAARRGVPGSGASACRWRSWRLPS